MAPSLSHERLDRIVLDQQKHVSRGCELNRKSQYKRNPDDYATAKDAEQPPNCIEGIDDERETLKPGEQK